MNREEELKSILIRCKTILTNMAAENEGFLNQIFNRWKINHEPLRNDAKNILRTIEECLHKC